MSKEVWPISGVGGNIRSSGTGVPQGKNDRLASGFKSSVPLHKISKCFWNPTFGREFEKGRFCYLPGSTLRSMNVF